MARAAARPWIQDSSSSVTHESSGPTRLARDRGGNTYLPPSVLLQASRVGDHKSSVLDARLLVHIGPVPRGAHEAARAPCSFRRPNRSRHSSKKTENV